MSDHRHVEAIKAEVGVIIVQIGNAAQILAAAAEFSDVVPQRRRADQRQVDREPGLFRENGRVQSDIVDADGMRCGVEGRRFHAEAHDGHKMAFPHGLLKACILCLHAASGNRVFRQWQQIEIGVKSVCRAGKRRFQRGQVRRLVRRQYGNLRQAVREHLRAELLIERG